MKTQGKKKDLSFKQDFTPLHCEKDGNTLFEQQTDRNLMGLDTFLTASAITGNQHHQTDN